MVNSTPINTSCEKETFWIVETINFYNIEIISISNIWQCYRGTLAMNVSGTTQSANTRQILFDFYIELQSKLCMVCQVSILSLTLSKIWERYFQFPVRILGTKIRTPSYPSPPLWIQNATIQRHKNPLVTFAAKHRKMRRKSRSLLCKIAFSQYSFKTNLRLTWVHNEIGRIMFLPSDFLRRALFFLNRHRYESKCNTKLGLLGITIG